jgi:hypothetical protein
MPRQPPEITQDHSQRTRRDASGPAPRWVRVLGIALVAAVLLAVGLHLAGRLLLSPHLGAHGGAPAAGAAGGGPQP